MKTKKFLLLSLCTILIGQADAQSFLRKLQAKAEDKSSDLLIKKGTEKVEKDMDGSIKSGQDQTPAKQPQTAQKNSNNELQTSAFKTYSKYDFVPGEKVLFAENFEQDPTGEFPLKWFTNGSGEVVTVEGVEGRWLMLTSGSTLSPMMAIPQSFTFEFDVILNMPANNPDILPSLSYEFLDSGNKNKALLYSELGTGYKMNNALRFQTTPQWKSAWTRMTSVENKATKLETPRIVSNEINHRQFGKVMHVAISIQGERVRMWYDENKIVDAPMAVATKHNFNQLKLSGNKTRAGQPAFYFTNFKLCSGVPNTRLKFLTEGKFATNGIQFDTNADKIKPSSYGVLKEVAAALKEGTFKVKIIGHTDTDGAADVNLSLSKRRAEAVKKALVDEFGITADILSTDGKGATQPLADNKTILGKAQNRRVEFIKQ